MSLPQNCSVGKVLFLPRFRRFGLWLHNCYASDPPADPIRDAVIRGPEMRQLLEAYWNNLWHSATPLNEGKRINWDELKAIAHRVGMSEEEFNSIVSKWTDEVQRRKRRGR